METLKHILYLFADHWREIFWAGVFALVFAVMLELLDFRSRLRGSIRFLKNKWSERSAGRLRKRISELRKQKDVFLAYMSSDKRLYLATLRFAIGVGVLIAAGEATAGAADILSRFNLIVGDEFHFMGVFCYGMAVAVGIQGIKISHLNSADRLSEIVGKLENEIEELNIKLSNK
jgi:hypothetical protein